MSTSNNTASGGAALIETVSYDVGPSGLRINAELYINDTDESAATAQCSVLLHYYDVATKRWVFDSFTTDNPLSGILINYVPPGVTRSRAKVNFTISRQSKKIGWAFASQALAFKPESAANSSDDLEIIIESVSDGDSDDQQAFIDEAGTSKTVLAFILKPNAQGLVGEVTLEKLFNFYLVNSADPSKTYICDPRSSNRRRP
jgi:hypothetical protein